MELNLGRGQISIGENKSLSVHYEESNEDPYVLTNIEEDRIVLRGFYSSEIICEEIIAKNISIECFSSKIILNNIKCELLSIDHPNIEIRNSNINLLIVNGERLLISNLQSNEITINLNMFMNDNDKGLKAMLKGINGKLLNLNLVRCKEEIRVHDVILSSNRISQLNLTLNGYKFILKCLMNKFDDVKVKMNIKFIDMDGKTRVQLNLNSLENFAKAIFTEDEFKEIMSYV